MFASGMPEKAIHSNWNEYNLKKKNVNIYEELHISIHFSVCF
jgi:hypothetical protein